MYWMTELMETFFYVIDLFIHMLKQKSEQSQSKNVDQSWINIWLKSIWVKTWCAYLTNNYLKTQNFAYFLSCFFVLCKICNFSILELNNLKVNILLAQNS